MPDANVAVVGAGLASLSCTIELERAELACTVIERDRRVGSINGAMASGRDAARAVVDDLRGPTP